MAKAQGQVDVKDFSGSIDLSDGLGVKLAAGLGSAEQASGLKKKADEALPMAKMGLAMVGLPATVADTVKIDAKDTLLSFEISLSASDLKTLQEKAGGLGGLVGGGGGPPPRPSRPSRPRPLRLTRLPPRPRPGRPGRRARALSPVAARCAAAVDPLRVPALSTPRREGRLSGLSTPVRPETTPS
ncbi:hypothetical protein [Nannocystis pusilla]|uniref:hypothetical protein n=1 Tax=Nannocystis pusilla TaxID=889268 RepID=UPI003B7ECC7D